MSATTALIAILGALLLGAISPGPSFVLVSRIAVTQSRARGLAAALGMGVGGALFATLALLGLVALLLRVEALALLVRVAGGLYLLWLGWRIWRGADAPLAQEGPVAANGATGAMARGGLGRAFLLALVTQLSNPKTALVYAGIFAALLPAAMPAWLPVLLPPLVLLVEAGWYALVALAFSAAAPRAAYLRGKGWLDRLAGAVMAALGLRLLLSR
ncbi:LysE family translocator [Teichococcus cervicalis]|uniref:Translocator protein, LysE family n=1 Tax=Pseudoroseomonas cervicalis ATCC 49957 TaxID=525371 RepID=D5RKK3_9PROT|nr:LysE family transporter [Pseudoroseomonas cervicalis]EFH12156.1 translocator protein, LysE family [Pseudoroseomonas cervicalis ATCC 49957]